ncbi:acyltransferase family protein [Aquimarina macrocephali]|uniref:acyltransferase family protein n=1 Tax=Aquimarina macrocephali TaxID=666563 RepID=UPI000465F8F4
MVVICHSYNVTGLGIERNKDWIYYIEYLFAIEMTRAFIGIFFFISGFLFFYNHDLKVKTFIAKLKKRCKTLVLPYVIWCVFWFFVIYAIQYIPEVSQFFKERIHDMPISKQIWLALVEPLNYPFWFIRELIFYVFLTPLVYLGIKYLRVFFLLILGGLIFIDPPSILSINNINLFQFYGLFVFSCGAYAAIHGFKLISRFKTPVYVLILLSWIICLVLNFNIREWYAESFWLTIVFKRITMVVGFITIWCLYDLLDRKYNFTNKSIYEFRFFIFATHGLAITYFTKIYVKLIGENDLALIALFFITPLITTIICFGMGRLIQKFTPKVYRLITGSR